jgi:glyoxylase-like metal-dependent hydrolase (beta-lactamase superfamily II)
MRAWPLFLFIGLAGTRLALAAAPAYAPVDVEMRVHKVSPHVYFVQGAAGAATDNKGFISNAGFVVTPAGVVVVDALGTPSLANKLLQAIRGVTPLPLRKVVVTHYHADHVYGLQVFKDQGADIIAPEGARDYLSAPDAETLLAARRTLLAPWIDARTRLVPPDRYVAADEHFTLGGVTFRLSSLGAAHSEGDMALLVEPDQVMFSGDVIFEGRVPFVGAANTRDWLATLTRLEAVQVTALIPGHGPAAADPKRALALTRRYLAFLREKMGAAVADWEPFDDAYEKIDWGEFMELPAFLEANRRNAYQVYLSMEKESLLPSPVPAAR